MPDLPPENGDDTGAPRWVKVFGIIAVFLVLLFFGLHLTGNSPGGHGSPMDHGSPRS